MNKVIIKDIFVIVVLATVMILRLFFNLHENVISLINILGMVISLISTTTTLTINLKRRFIMYGAGIIVIEIIASAIILCMVGFDVLKLETKANDIITILALLFSIPIEFYKKIEMVSGIAKKQS